MAGGRDGQALGAAIRINSHPSVEATKALKIVSRITVLAGTINDTTPAAQYAIASALERPCSVGHQWAQKDHNSIAVLSPALNCTVGDERSSTMADVRKTVDVGTRRNISAERVAALGRPGSR